MSIKDVSGLKCSALGEHDLKAKYRSVPQIRPPFCNLRLSTKCRGGGLIRGMRQFLSRLRPLPGMKSLSVGGGTKRWASPSVRQRDAHDASGRLKSFSVEERGSRALPQNSWRVHR